MSALPTPAATLPDARRTRMTGRSLHLHLPLLIGAIATAGAVTQLDAASRDGGQALEQARAMRLVEDAQALLPDATPPAADSGIAPVSMMVLPPRDTVRVHPPLAAPQPDGVPAIAPGPASAADRLRNDAVQTAPVPVRVSRPLPPVKLSSDERAIARYIARSYRIASESVERFVHHAYRAASEFRLDPHLILAVMAVESSFDPHAESAAGAQGLMQVHTRVHTSKFDPFGGEDAAWDPVANIRVGARILSEYVNRYGDVAAGLKAYVGAALLGSDGGYGSKVLKRQAEFDAVLRPEPPLATAEALPVEAEAAPQVAARGAGAMATAAEASPAAGSTAVSSDAAGARAAAGTGTGQ